MFEDFDRIVKEKNLKYSDVARGAGISYSTITDWKAGRYTPKADKLQKIADFLDVKIWDLESEYIVFQSFDLLTELQHMHDDPAYFPESTIEAGAKDAEKLNKERKAKSQERKMLESFRFLSETNKDAALQYLTFLCEQEKRKSNSASNA